MRTRRKILIAVGIALGVAILIPIIHHYQLRAATESYIAELKAKGEPMELAQLIPPTLPPESNSADILLHAAAQFDPVENWQETNYANGMMPVAPGKAIVCWQQSEIHDEDGTNSWNNVMISVAHNVQAFQLLRKIIDKPAFDFQVKYDLGAARLDDAQFEYSQTHGAADRLQTAVLADLHQGDAEKAVENLSTILALVKAERDERAVVAERNRMAIADIARAVTWEILQSPELTDQQLAGLQNQWNDLEFVKAGANALEMERITMEISIAKLRDSNSELRYYPGFFWAKPDFEQSSEMAAYMFLWRYWRSYPEEMRCLKVYEVLINAMRTADTDGCFQNALLSEAAGLSKLGISQMDGPNGFLPFDYINPNSILSDSIAVAEEFPAGVLRAEVVKNLAVTAIAVKRYELKHGGYPENLSELTPDFLPSVPLDPVDGEPLHYRKNNQGTFLLYSVGPNGKDNGGDPSLEKSSKISSLWWLDPLALDWVWPQPANAAEIQKYYEKETKKFN
jgi:hypothetical protein